MFSSASNIQSCLSYLCCRHWRHEHTGLSRVWMFMTVKTQGPTIESGCCLCTLNPPGQRPENLKGSNCSTTCISFCVLLGREPGALTMAVTCFTTELYSSPLLWVTAKQPGVVSHRKILALEKQRLEDYSKFKVNCVTEWDSLTQNATCSHLRQWLSSALGRGLCFWPDSLSPGLCVCACAFLCISGVLWDVLFSWLFEGSSTQLPKKLHTKAYS